MWGWGHLTPRGQYRKLHFLAVKQDDFSFVGRLSEDKSLPFRYMLHRLMFHLLGCGSIDSIFFLFALWRLQMEAFVLNWIDRDFLFYFLWLNWL
jgi:hypothetical protein